MRTKTWRCRGRQSESGWCWCSVEVGVRRASVGAEARWCQSPRFSASLIGLRVRVCDGAAGTMNVGSRAPADPSFIWRYARGGAHCHERQAPPIRTRLGSGRSGDLVPIWRSGWDEITSLRGSRARQPRAQISSQRKMSARKLHISTIWRVTLDDPRRLDTGKAAQIEPRTRPPPGEERSFRSDTNPWQTDPHAPAT
jgi:hypothetical protein